MTVVAGQVVQVEVQVSSSIERLRPHLNACCSRASAHKSTHGAFNALHKPPSTQLMWHNEGKLLEVLAVYTHDAYCDWIQSAAAPRFRFRVQGAAVHPVACYVRDQSKEAFSCLFLETILAIRPAVFQLSK